MRRHVFLSVSLGAVMLLSGCAQMAVSGLSMAANLGAISVLQTGANKRRSEKCYNVELAARKKSPDPAFIKKELVAEGCPV